MAGSRGRSLAAGVSRNLINDGHWTRMASNHLLTVTTDLEVNVELMPIERRESAFDRPGIAEMKS